MFVLAVAVGTIVGLTVRRRSTYGPPRALPLIVVAALLQVVGGSVAERLRPATVGLSVALGIVWLFGQRRHAASVLLALGAGANALVVVANGGMPVDSDALATVGRAHLDVAQGFLYKHVPLDSGSRLSLLADRIPIPIQRNVISIGDVVMAAAIALWVADAVAGWRSARRSAGTMDGQHGGGPEAGFVANRVRS
ncbi:MAG: hypothetical protein QOG30_1676 [Acidimicrobiaceae bacterium]